MKRILLVLCLISGPLFALTPQEENDFITTITSGNLDALRAKLDKGFSPDYQFTLMGFRGHTPLSIAQMERVPNYEYRNNTVQLKGTKPNAANQAAVYELLASADRKAKETKELNLYNAIQKADLAAVKKAVESGSLLTPFASIRAKAGFTPLQYAYGKDAKHKEIMEYLLSKGADSSVLQGMILPEALDGDVEMVRWLLAHGVKDKNNAAVNELTARVKEVKYSNKKAVYEQIIELIRNSK